MRHREDWCFFFLKGRDSSGVPWDKQQETVNAVTPGGLRSDVRVLHVELLQSTCTLGTEAEGGADAPLRFRTGGAAGSAN